MFEAKQSKHRGKARGIIGDAHATITSTMLRMYENFETDPADVQREWAAFVRRTDRRQQEALRTTVKKSLQELSRAINGDSKNEPPPLFKVNVVLDGHRVEFKPSMINLTQMVNVVSKELITVVDVVPRLEAGAVPMHTSGGAGAGAGAGAGGGSATAAAAAIAAAGEPAGADGGAASLPTFYDEISNDEEILKILVAIMNGMSSSATELQKHLSYWDKYKHLWETDKLNFIRRYARMDRPLNQFDIDISRYRDQQNDIRTSEEVNQHINFIKIDCSLLKAALIDHCQQWQRHLTNLLHENATKELEALNNLMVNNTKLLLETPRSLEHLSQSLSALGELRRDTPSIVARFGAFWSLSS